MAVGSSARLFPGGRGASGNNGCWTLVTHLGPINHMELSLAGPFSLREDAGDADCYFPGSLELGFRDQVG